MCPYVVLLLACLPSPAMADGIIFLAGFTFPGMVLALLPVIGAEAWIFAKLWHLPAHRAVGLSTRLNLASTLMGNLVALAFSLPPLVKFLAPLGHLGYVGAAAVVVLVMFILTLAVEFPLAQRELPPGPVVWPVVLKANMASYGMVVSAILLMPLFPPLTAHKEACVAMEGIEKVYLPPLRQCFRVDRSGKSCTAGRQRMPTDTADSPIRYVGSVTTREGVVIAHLEAADPQGRPLVYRLTLESFGPSQGILASGTAADACYQSVSHQWGIPVPW